MKGAESLDDLRAFLQERWRGERPVLWHSQIMQAELKEALYCGSFDLETQARFRIADFGMKTIPDSLRYDNQ